MLRKLNEYEFFFEGVAIIKVNARYEKEAICKAFQEVKKGDFKIVEYFIGPSKENEKD